MISIVISISVLILKKIDILTLKKEDFWGKKLSMILILDQDHFFDIIWSWSEFWSKIDFEKMILIWSKIIFKMIFPRSGNLKRQGKNTQFWTSKGFFDR
jgi:hypothetical protein